MPTPVTLPEARGFTADHYGSRAGDLTVLGAGEWSRAYAFSLDGADAVIRFGAYGEDFAKDRLMARHASERLPIPRVIEIGEALGGSFAVAERVHGTLLDELDGPAMQAALPALFAALDATREIDTSSSSGYGLWEPDRSAPHQTWRDALLDAAVEYPRTAGWRAALAASDVGAGPFGEAFDVLAELSRDLPPERHIIHSDLLNRNVLVAGTRIAAVLDWGNAMYGDWLYDAAWLIYWWPWYSAWSAIDVAAALERHWLATGGLPPDYRKRLRCYQLHIGITAQSYNAFTARWDELKWNADKTLQLARGH